MESAPSELDAYDVIWNTASKDAAGSMPIGNGEVVLNVWVEESTGDLMFYIARTDAMSEISRYLKLGRVRVHMSPSPLRSAADFTQHLRLRDGRIEISGGGARLGLYVDANSNAIHITGKSDHPLEVTAKIECWRNEPRELPKAEWQSAWAVHDAPFPAIESADVFLPSDNPSVTWYHRNETTVVPKIWENQSLTGLKGAFDPLIHRTFGGRIEGSHFVQDGGRGLQSSKASQDFNLQISTYTAQTSTVGEWMRGLETEASRGRRDDSAATTRNWWHEFWNRSWVVTNAGGSTQVQSPITRGYVLQRYVQACQGRGVYPIKFNGGYYTVEPAAMGKGFNPDWRNWGDCHWYQNVRHMYHPMLASGDIDMMEPFFKLYEAARPLAESRTKKYHGADGAYFPETMTVFGTYSGGDYGWDRLGKQPQDVDCKYWQFAWNQGPELVALMLDRWDYTRDERFLKQRLLPMADSVLRYFDTRFRRDSQGKIVLDPTQVIETYWYGVVNDMPTTSGLIAITNRLCSLPPAMVSVKQRAFFTKMKEACPDLPTREKDGVTMLAPAQKFNPETSNSENGELYGVWPFQIVSLAHPARLAEAKAAYAHRLNRNDVGWGYDGNAAALLGLTDEAARIMTAKCANSNPKFRWPASWGPNYDWVPDQNHGGNLLNTANLMLLQAEPIEAGGAIRVLPAWPKSWDVDFKLHAPGMTTIHCIAKGGKIVKLEVLPESRMKDVIWPSEWKE